MPTLTYTHDGKKATTTAKLAKEVFGVDIASHELIKSAYVAHLANGRQNLAVTMTRGLISGGGRKPWKQKGTGRARFGSSRNPIWRGGGIVFGPTGIENYKHKITTKSKRQAIRQALTLAAQNDKVVVIESIKFSGKTSEAVKLFEKVGAKRTILLAVENLTPEVTQSTRNISNVKTVQSTYLNVYDIMNADRIILTTDGLKAVHAWLTPEAKS